MKFHRSYHHKYWFGIMWINGSRRRMFGHKVIHMLEYNPLKCSYIKAKPRCWISE